MAADGHIPPEAVELGRSPEIVTGIERPTIGYELEITEPCVPDTPVLASGRTSEAFLSDGANTLKAERYGYFLFSDQEFELASPVGETPLQLALTAKGLVAIGWIPERTEAEAPLHINLGIPRIKPGEAGALLPRTIDMLRAMDILGASSADRIEQSYIDGRTRVSYWDARGFGGVSLKKMDGEVEHPGWQGEKDRIELRTPVYKDLNQFLRDLERAFYLTAGLTGDPLSDARAAYDSFEDYLRDYLVYHNLASAHDIDLQELDAEENSIRDSRLAAEALDGYLSPFVAHIRDEDASAKDELLEVTTETMLEIRSSLGLDEVPMGTNGEIIL